MGDEIPNRFFDAEDFSRFRERLDAETALLQDLLADRCFSSHGDMAGFELEAWLVDALGDPLPDNQQFLEQLDNSLVVPELAKFNVELNGSPTKLTGNAFSRMFDELSATWSACRAVADRRGCGLITIGTLPTARPEIFCAENMSEMLRYHTLNDRVMALRDGRNINVSIDGTESLNLQHHDVMLESAATSLQIHLQCRPQNFVRDFNASIIASAPVVAASANAPLLFGHELWDESRIPLFEQSVNIGQRYPPRVSFGDSYLQQSPMELFQDNQANHPVLIPLVQDLPVSTFSHLKFHNGTVWRWNRPLIGFDADGQPHLRIEHRVASAGPTIRDSIANAAFYYGIVYGLRLDKRSPESMLQFDAARENFYKAARYGLNAQLLWADAAGEIECSARSLILQRLLPLARRGLESLNLPASEISDYLEIINQRVDSSQNGAAWQRRWRSQHGVDLHDLTLRYRELQDTGAPVHTWPL